MQLVFSLGHAGEGGGVNLLLTVDLGIRGLCSMTSVIKLTGHMCR